jgi:antitoxin (DNA-binding transcriptional repressor) of toxin-antitoxin stability system
MAAVTSINLRQLRDTRQLKAWLKAGKTVELRERNTVLARIVPEPAEQKPVEWPDAAARRRAIFGDRIFETNAVLDAREDSRY